MATASKKSGQSRKGKRIKKIRIKMTINNDKKYCFESLIEAN